VAVDALRPAVAGELRRFLDENASGFPAADLVHDALRARGRSLAGEGGFCWGVLPLLVCEAAGGDPERALPVGVALECLISALDILDDVEDRDNPGAPWQARGRPTAINVATFLLFLSQLAVGYLARRGAPAETVLEVGRVFAAAGARACGGQQRDLDELDGRVVDEATYLATIGDKSGALVEGACRAGALLGTDDRAVIEACARFGFNFGVALQIQNDLAAVSCEWAERTDLRTGKRTLPVIFALECAPAPIRTELIRIFAPGRREDLTAEGVGRARVLLAASGGLLYASVVADVYRERALACLDGLDRARIERLRALTE
jgi:geranylgeranyl pyrophosphate synthase